MVFDHLDHCINNIRESLTCNADLTPITYHWNEGWQVSNIDFNVVHTCVSWDAIQAWAVENKAHVKFDQFHHVVDDLMFPDNSKI